MVDTYNITISPAPVSDIEKQRWANRLLAAKNDIIAGVDATDYAQALQKALEMYYEKVVAPGAAPAIVRGYAKLAARLPAVDPNELKEKLKAAIQSDKFDQAVHQAVEKWADIVSYVKGAGIGGRTIGQIIAKYVNPDVAPFTVPGVVAATVLVGYMGLILAAAVNHGYDLNEAKAMLGQIALGTLKPVIEKVLSGDATLQAFSVDLSAGTEPSVAIYMAIEKSGTQQTGGATKKA